MRLRSGLLPVVSTVLLVILFRDLFLSFLDLPMDRWGEGTQGAVLRLGIAIVGWLALDTYTALVRGPDRAVLDILPVDAGQVAVFELIRVAVERWWVVPVGALLLAPIGLEGAPLLWALAVVAICGAWAMGLTASAMVNLFAIQVAEGEAEWLDLIRGSNPRAQAAFIYAPGVALLISGYLVGQAAAGARAVHAGQPLGALWLVLPFFVAAACAWPIPGLARSSWFRASMVLAEIDARYAAFEDREEGLRVYLDWAVRFLPATVARYALLDLRHGWRTRRTLIVGAWLGGAAAFVAGWTEAATGPGRAALVGIGVVWLCAAVGVLIERDEPPFLRVWLPDGGLSRTVARLLVLAAWLQPCLWLPTLSVALRRGTGDALVPLLGVTVAIVLAASVAWVCGRFRGRELQVYVPVAAVTAALLGLWVTP